MTNDTKRAIEIIEPMAKELNIEVSADDKFLYCNGQAIGISANSTYATIKEFIGYALCFLDLHDPTYRLDLPQALKKRIQRYWFTEDHVKMLKKMEHQNGGD